MIAIGRRRISGAEELFELWQDRGVAGLHHVEIWIVDLVSVRREWGWLLERLGFTLIAEWERGLSWEAGGSYLTLTTSPNLASGGHDRRRPGVNHLAFSAGSAPQVDAIIADATAHGWVPLYADRYPHAGGEGHYAGWLENAEGFKVEIVAG